MKVINFFISVTLFFYLIGIVINAKPKKPQQGTPNPGKNSILADNIAAKDGTGDKSSKGKGKKSPCDFEDEECDKGKEDECDCGDDKFKDGKCNYDNCQKKVNVNKNDQKC